MKWVPAGLLCVFAACTAAHPPESPVAPSAEDAERGFVKTDRLTARTCHTKKGAAWPNLLPREALFLDLEPDLTVSRRDRGAQDRAQCWYSHKILSLKEDSLLPLAPDSEVYRFTWIPSFHADRVIRVERRGSVYSLHVKVTGTEEGTLSMDRRILLTPTQWQALQQRLEQARFWTLDPFSSPPAGVTGDGAGWLFEGGRNGRYQALDIHSPNTDGRAGLFYNLGAFLLELSGIPMTEDTLY